MLDHIHNRFQTKRYKLLVGTITCCFILPLSACSFLPKEEPVLAPPLVEPAKVQYDVVEVKKGSIVKRMVGVGSLTPIKNHNLFYPNSGGRLKKIHISEGDIVKKGEVLVEFESGNLQFDLQQTEIDLKKAKLHLKQLENQKANTFSIEMAKLDVQAVSLRVQHMKDQLSKAQLTAPMDGMVTFVGEQKIGDVIEPFQSIVQVADTNHLQLLYTATNEEELSDVKLGMMANLHLNGHAFTGKIVQTPEDVPEDVMGTNPELFQKSILISLENLPANSKVGDLIDVEIITQQKEDIIIIPKNGLRKSMGRNYVQILEEKSKRELDIEIGLVTATEVEVIKGLNEGDKVILK